MHRFLLGFPEEQTDHINRVKCDNRLKNLREVSRRMNNNNKSNHGLWPIGVSYHKINKKFIGSFSYNCKSRYLGYYIDPISPSILYDMVRDELERLNRVSSMKQVKRLNLSLSNPEYELLKEQAENCCLKPTTYAAMIVKQELKALNE